MRFYHLKPHEIIRHEVINFLLNHPCVDCGEKDLLVLEFDHIKGKKKASVGTLIARGKAADIILKEIAKCDVRCANCHRRKTGQTAWRLN